MGWACEYFREDGAPPLTYEGDFYVIKIEKDGTFHTSGQGFGKTGLGELDYYYYYNERGERQPLPDSYRRRGAFTKVYPGIKKYILLRWIGPKGVEATSLTSCIDSI